jgi:hypothetical protein
MGIAHSESGQSDKMAEPFQIFLKLDTDAPKQPKREL